MVYKLIQIIIDFVMMEDNFVHFTLSFDIDSFMKVVKLVQLDVPVDVDLHSTVLFRDFACMTLIVVIAPVAVT